MGFGIMDLAACIKTHLESREREKKLDRGIRELECIIREGQLIEPRLLIQKEKDLMNSAKEEIWMLGIKALGVFHESCEEIIRFIKERKGRVVVLART